MPVLATNALIDPDETMLYLGMEEHEEEAEEIVTLLINLVSEVIRVATKVNFIQTAYEEIRDGRGDRSLWVHHSPIIGDPTVSFWNNSSSEWEDVTGSSWNRTLMVDAGQGEITFRDRSDMWPTGDKMIKIDYDGGVATIAEVPLNVKLAALELVGMYHKKAGGNLHGVRSVAIQGQTTSYTLDTFPETVKKLLKDVIPICL